MPDVSAIDIPKALQHVQFQNYLDMASIAILVYDYWITFSLEVEYIWPSSWSIAKGLFLITRYLPFVDAATVLSRNYIPGLSTGACELIYRINAISILVGVVIGESTDRFFYSHSPSSSHFYIVILSLRTWAVWGKGRKFGILLAIFTVVVVIPTIPVLTRVSDSTKFIMPPQPLDRGCFFVGGSRLLSLSWMILMLYDGVLLMLMVIKGFRELSLTANQRLLRVVLQQGILYYLYLFGLSTANVIIIWTLPVDRVNLMALLERIIHALLTCRVVFYIRQQVSTQQMYGHSLTSVIASSVEFENHPLQVI
ncbi:hypothetical protein BDQ12DRAFT_657458 [Crucibulum laeve]|uniref:DUF6533 domain-containing protein n=1 Tax=Crucibulum laeve TaxID=68775 RepID=A0A5C3LPN5_9AGAR|nr:hypothetical protein BDQ12DRAFT_657458 [Crucibulum laeve]